MGRFPAWRSCHGVRLCRDICPPWAGPQHQAPSPCSEAEASPPGPGKSRRTCRCETQRGDRGAGCGPHRWLQPSRRGGTWPRCAGGGSREPAVLAAGAAGAVLPEEAANARDKSCSLALPRPQTPRCAGWAGSCAPVTTAVPPHPWQETAGGRPRAVGSPRGGGAAVPPPAPHGSRRHPGSHPC